MTEQRPWRDREALVGLVDGWQQRFAGREVFRAITGPGWTGLLLAGEDRPSLYLLAGSAATLLFDQRGSLPEAIISAFGQTQRTPLNSLLAGRQIEACGVMPDDAVVALRFAPLSSEATAKTTAKATGTATAGASTKGPLILLHQLFGPRGNVVLLDRNARLLWSLHRPPHRVLCSWPPAATWSLTGSTETDDDEDRSGVADDFRRAGLNQLSTALAVKESNRLNQLLRRRLRSSTRLVGKLEPEFADADQGAEYRRQAETLAVHLRSVPAGASSVELADPRDGQPLRIELDPARDAVANMEHYFRRARKAKRGRDLIAERLAAAQRETDRLLGLRNELEGILTDIAPTQWHEDVFTAPRLAVLLDWRRRHAAALGLDETGTIGGKGRRSPDQPARPFRRYLIDKRWEVWVGRNNKENDELTHRASAQRDIWLHAQGTSGSHVILRTEGRPQDVPKRIIAKAAALAALHSKARNATVVPVIYTERRYVRKPRRSPAGTATCLRHESLFIEPGLPTDTVAH